MLTLKLKALRIKHSRETKYAMAISPAALLYRGALSFRSAASSEEAIAQLAKGKHRQKPEIETFT